MAYNTNLEKLEKQLAQHGIDVAAARQSITNSEPGFFLNLSEETNPDQANMLLQKIRSLLYSWLHCLNVKDYYSIKLANKALQVRRKVALTGKGSFGVLSQIGPESFTEAAGFADIMPTEESKEAEERLLSLME